MFRINGVHRANKYWFKLVILLGISFILVISAARFRPLNDIKEGTSLEDFTVHLNERIPVLMEAYGIPGVNIALVQDGKRTWSNAYGYADVEEGRRMTKDTYCRVESISKPVTAWGIMKLVQEGEIELDAPIVQYLKSWSFPESDHSPESITVRQLLSHTAGLPLGDVFERYSPTEKMPSLEESLANEVRLFQEPGGSFYYSNTGYNLLELLIEEVTGRDFAEYMEAEVLKPLGMNNSSFTWRIELQPEVPVGYDGRGNPIPVYVYPEKASGGLLASVEDIAKFITDGMGEHQNNEMYTPMVSKIGVYSFVFDAYGLGHYIEHLPNGLKAVSHGGQGGGCMTHFHSVPETGDGIVILTNSQRSWPFFSYILSGWAQWSGIEWVGMGRIIIGQRILWMLVGILCFFILLTCCNLVQELSSGRRRFWPSSKESLTKSIVQIVFSIVLMAGITWCGNMDYLFITSVFPRASVWLGYSVFVYAIALLLSAVFPRLEKSLTNNGN